MWVKLIPAVLKFLSWLGTVLIARKGGRDAERADNAEETLETVDRVTAPVSNDERDKLWAQNVAKFGGRVRDDPGA